MLALEREPARRFGLDDPKADHGRAGNTRVTLSVALGAAE